MITTCPECRTAFRVTEEQLGAREGRVRCGKCTTIFDARGTLRPESYDPVEEGGHSDDRPAPPAQPPRGAPVPESTARAQTTPAPEPSLAQRFEATGAEEPLFPANEPRPQRRLFWGLSSSLLLLLLLAQITFHYRGELALLFPEARPAIAELCSSFGCSVPLPRRAELVSIEASDLQADPANPSVMVLTATLRNRAAFAQSHPALELTLTDTQDQPLARKILGVQDYLARGASIEAGFPGNSELPVKIYMEAASLKATGYRLYLFYP